MTAMRDRAELDVDRDVMVSWLPTFHDMGMVGFLTVPMTFGVELVKVTPSEFLAGPLLWIDLISRYKATVTAAPNFAYAVVGKRLARVEDDKYDLSSLRIALNGAEPIDASAVRTFTDAGARFGLDPRCVFAADGMAEATLAVSFAPLFSGLQVDVVEAEVGVWLARWLSGRPVDVVGAEALENGKRAVPVPEDDPRRETDKVRQFALLGTPLPGLEARIVDESGNVLPDRHVGEIQLR